MAVAARLPKVAGAGKEYWGQNIYEVNILVPFHLY